MNDYEDRDHVHPPGDNRALSDTKAVKPEPAKGDTERIGNGQKAGHSLPYRESRHSHGSVLPTLSWALGGEAVKACRECLKLRSERHCGLKLGRRNRVGLCLTRDRCLNHTGCDACPGVCGVAGSVGQRAGSIGDGCVRHAEGTSSPHAVHVPYTTCSITLPVRELFNVSVRVNFCVPFFRGTRRLTVCAPLSAAVKV